MPGEPGLKWGTCSHGSDIACDIRKSLGMSAVSDRPLAVVTGANRGIGLGVVQALELRDIRLFLVCRSQKVTVRLAQEFQAEVFIADVTSAEDVEAMAARLEDVYGRVDILVNNAAIAPDLGTQSRNVSGGMEGEIDLVRRTMETNFIGAYRVGRVLMPLLRRSSSPRIVNVSSNLGRLQTMGAGSVGYRASKAALNALTRIWAAELSDTPAKVNSVSPGWVRTDMGGKQADRSVEEGAASVVWACMLPDDGPTGGFYFDGEHMEW